MNCRVFKHKLAVDIACLELWKMNDCLLTLLGEYRVMLYGQLLYEFQRNVF